MQEMTIVRHIRDTGMSRISMFSSARSLRRQLRPMTRASTGATHQYVSECLINDEIQAEQINRESGRLSRHGLPDRLDGGRFDDRQRRRFRRHEELVSANVSQYVRVVAGSQLPLRG